MQNGEIDWKKVKRILIVKLRSIGDTVLSTPSLISLRKFLPDSQIDILLEDWVAPLLEGFDQIDNVISVGKGSASRLKTAFDLRRSGYDVVFNLHGGTTATFFALAAGAPHRVGFADYQFSFLYNHRLLSAAGFWEKEFTHSAEQQLALLGFVGVPVDDLPKSRLTISDEAVVSVGQKISAKKTGSSAETTSVTVDLDKENLVLIHPTSAFATKQWSVKNFARTAEYLAKTGFQVIAIASQNESDILTNLRNEATVPIWTFDDLTLPEITALASKSKLFVGNDSGIAHIAAAVQTPTVVIFGSSNRNHWRPWTGAPNEIVFEELPCQPCPGYVCAEFGEPRCILSVSPKAVWKAIEKVVDLKNRI